MTVSPLLCSALAAGLVGCFVVDGPCDETQVDVTGRVSGNVELVTSAGTTDHAITAVAANDAGNDGDAASLEDAGLGQTGSVCTSVVDGANRDGGFLLDVICQNANGPRDANTLDLPFTVPDPRTLDAGARSSANLDLSVTYANGDKCDDYGDDLLTVPIDVTTSYSQTNQSTLEFSLAGQINGSQVRVWLDTNSTSSCADPFPFSSLSFNVVVDQGSGDFNTSTTCD